MSVRGWIGAAVILSFGAVLLLSCPFTSPAQNDPTPLRRDLPILFHRFNQKSEPLDYVIVIDRSRSMKGYWDHVSDGLIEFVNVLSVGDHVSIVLFGDPAVNDNSSASSNQCLRNLAIPGNLITSAQIKSNVIQEIQSLCQPDGGNTDIGEALEKALAELNRPGGHTLKIVFFFTDFKHEPKDDSRYAKKYVGTEDAWQQLAAQRRNELSGKTVLSYAMILNTGRETGRDIKLAQTVFPDLEQVPVNESSLVDYFTRIKSEFQRDRLKAAVKEAQLITQPIIKNLYQHENELIALLEVPANPLLTTESLSNVRISDIKAGPLTEHLLPIGDTDREYPVNKTSHQVQIPIATLKTNDLISWRETTQFSFTLKAQQNMSPALEITKLNLPASLDRELVTNAITVSAAGGRLSYIILTAIVLFIGLVVMVLQRRLRRDFILGVFTISDSKKAPIGRQGFTRKDKRTEYAIGDGRTTTNDGYRIPGAEWELLFYAVTPGLFGQRGTYLEVTKGIAELMVNGRMEQLQPGDPPKLISSIAFVQANGYSVEFDPS